MSVDIRKIANNNYYVGTVNVEEIADGVWTRSERELTQDMAVDVPEIADGVWTRSERELTQEIGGGTMTVYENSTLMDGSEQQLVATEIAAAHLLNGLVDLSSLLGGDTVTVREYISIVTPVSYAKYAEKEISGPLDLSILSLATKPSKYGVKVTLQQSSGTYRTIPWQFFLIEEE